MNNDLNLYIRDQDGIIYNGPVKYITSYNQKGKFDVLPKHANFISIIEKNLVYGDIENIDHKIDLINGVMKVLNNQVSVYLGIGT